MTQSGSRLTVIKKIPTLDLSQENSNFSNNKTSIAKNLAIISKSCERPLLRFQRRNSPDLRMQESTIFHRQTSNKSVKTRLKLRDLTPNSQSLRNQITILKSQIREFSLQNAEIRKSLQNIEPPHIKSLKSELKLLKSHQKLLKSKIKAQSALINQPQPTTLPDPEYINHLKSAQTSLSQYFKLKFSNLKHQILLTSQSIESFSQHLSTKKLSCRQKLLKIQATLRKKRKFRINLNK